jgi:hypothetical protein
MPIIGIKYLTQLFKVILLNGFFPAQWKFAQIFLIPNPGKTPNVLTFYRTCSSHSKVFETLLLKRIVPLVEDNCVISHHQFGFRQRLCAKEQTHRIVQNMN